MFLKLFNQLRVGWLEYFSEFILKLSNCRLVKMLVGQEKLNFVAVDYHLQIDEVVSSLDTLCSSIAQKRRHKVYLSASFTASL